MFVLDCLWENNTKKLYAKMRGRNYVVQTRACSKISFGSLKRQANRASETEEQRKKRLRIRHEKKKEQKGNGRPRETAPGHSQKIEARCEN